MGLVVLVLLFAIIGLLEALTGFDPDEAVWLLVILLIGFFALLAGIVVLGIAAAVEATLPRIPAILLAVALPLGLLIDAILGEDSDVGGYVAFGGLALALIWLGYALRSGEHPRAGSGERTAGTGTEPGALTRLPAATRSSPGTRAGATAPSRRQPPARGRPRAARTCG